MSARPENSGGTKKVDCTRTAKRLVKRWEGGKKRKESPKEKKKKKKEEEKSCTNTESE